MTEEKKALKLQVEIERIEALRVYENEYDYCEFICGIDEAGRGPLSGPVVAGAVILPKGCRILYVNDSKKLSEKKRSELYDIIMQEAISVGVGIISPARIDEINILQATYEAMREAIQKLTITPDILLNDAVTIPFIDIAQVPIISYDNPQNRHTLHNQGFYFSTFESIKELVNSQMNLDCFVPSNDMVKVYNWDQIILDYESIF